MKFENKKREDILSKLSIATDLEYSSIQIKAMKEELKKISCTSLNFEKINKKEEELTFLSEFLLTTEEVYLRLVNFRKESLLYLTSLDKKTRRNSYRKSINLYIKNKELIDYLMIKNIKDKNSATNKIFEKSYRDCVLEEDNFSVSAFNTFVECIHQSFNISQSMIKLEILKKNTSRLLWEDVFYYPVNLNYDFIKINIRELILEFSSVLGNPVKNSIQALFDNNNIYFKNDIITPYTMKFHLELPIIVTNKISTFDDLVNLVHELGHAIFNIFYKETDIVNNLIFDESFAIYFEILFYQFLLNKHVEDTERISFLESYRIERMRGLIYRQNIVTEMEIAIDAGDNDLENIYTRSLKHYFGNDVFYNIYSRNEYLSNSHIFDPYYSYKYSVGAILAIHYSLNSENINNINTFLSNSVIDIENCQYIYQSLDQISYWINDFKKKWVIAYPGQKKLNNK
ncbi:hypothetical protein [Enterococcus sp. DIV1420a]|uniref:hypothetical protein n=1 Tax=Enterococcus sp. DIV1420a TaxID=2774672 RepID=UPI003F2004CC